MKLLQFVQQTLKDAKVDLTKLGLTDLTVETDLPDEVVNSYSNNLLTRERVEADPEINKTMQARAFKALNDGWDKDFTSFAEANLPKEIVDKIKAEPFTRNKWDLLRKNWVPSPKDDKVAQAEIAKLHDQLKEREAVIEATKLDYEGRLKGFQKNYLLTQKLSAVQWQDQFVPLQAMLQENFVKELNQKSIILELSNEQLIPKRKAETGELLDVYEANVKVGLDDLITKELGKYFKQSAGNGNPPVPPIKIIDKTLPKEGLTLAELERVKIQEKFAKLKEQVK